MKISSTALKAKRSCASGYRWFARRFKSPAEYQNVIDALVAEITDELADPPAAP